MRTSWPSRRAISSSSWRRRQRTRTGWRECWRRSRTSAAYSPPPLYTCWPTDTSCSAGMGNSGAAAFRSADIGWFLSDIISKSDKINGWFGRLCQTHNLTRNQWKDFKYIKPADFCQIKNWQIFVQLIFGWFMCVHGNCWLIVRMNFKKKKSAYSKKMCKKNY